MTSIEQFIAEALKATPEKREQAMAVLTGRIAPEPYETLRAIAKKLGVGSACTLWRWGVPGHELGGRRRFRLSEVLAYLESQEFKNRIEQLRKAKAAGRVNSSTKRGCRE